MKINQDSNPSIRGFYEIAVNKGYGGFIYQCNYNALGEINFYATYDEYEFSNIVAKFIVKSKLPF
jgi:hypothetical protein